MRALPQQGNAITWWNSAKCVASMASLRKTRSMEKYFFGVNTPDVLNCCPNLNSIFAEIACHEKATSTTAIEQTKNYNSNHEHHEHPDNQQTTYKMTRLTQTGTYAIPWCVSSTRS